MRWDRRVPPPAIPLEGRVVSEPDIPVPERRQRRPFDPHLKVCHYCGDGLFNARELREHIDQWYTFPMHLRSRWLKSRPLMLLLL